MFCLTHIQPVAPRDWERRSDCSRKVLHLLCGSANIRLGHTDPSIWLHGHTPQGGLWTPSDASRPPGCFWEVLLQNTIFSVNTFLSSEKNLFYLTIASDPANPFCLGKIFMVLEWTFSGSHIGVSGRQSEFYSDIHFMTRKVPKHFHFFKDRK